jgi:hypothetical protein
MILESYRVPTYVQRICTFIQCTDYENVDYFSVVDLTLIDLPGLTKVPVGDQPSNIDQLVYLS